PPRHAHVRGHVFCVQSRQPWMTVALLLAFHPVYCGHLQGSRKIVTFLAVSELPVVTLMSSKPGEISYEIGPDGTLRLPRGESVASLSWRGEEEHGPGEGPGGPPPREEQPPPTHQRAAQDHVRR